VETQLRSQVDEAELLVPRLNTYGQQIKTGLGAIPSQQQFERDGTKILSTALKSLRKTIQRFDDVRTKVSIS
jgi:hypothetical protein